MVISLEDRKALRPWMVSMHGGHSQEFCDHAEGSLRELLDSAIGAGYHTFGVTEHAPRWEERHLYPNEISLGWTIQKIICDFDRYVEALQRVSAEYEGKLNVVKGFECEVVPGDSYVEKTIAYRNRVTKLGTRAFDYVVGSVHYVHEMSIDGNPSQWHDAAEAAGGAERLAINYYDAVEQLAAKVRPDIIGHFDLIKLNAARAGFTVNELTSDRVTTAARHALGAIRDCNAILDLNVAAWRKGMDEPYPAPWVVKLAREIGIPFCFGDDSHKQSQVGWGLDRARAYLLENGIQAVTYVCPGGGRSCAEL